MRYLPRNPLFRLLAVTWLHGLDIAIVFEAALLAANVGGLRDLIASAEQPVLALGLLFAGLLITCTSVSMGAGVISLPYGKDE
jgi:hypothetical protein